MPSVLHPLNQLLQAVPAVEFEALRPHLEFDDISNSSIWSGKLSLSKPMRR
jgi:hypothetical protein